MKDTILIILSTIGSIGTIYTVFRTMLDRHAKIDISIVECVPAKDSVIIYMMFVNRSHLPISITDVKIWNHGTIYSCVQVPTVVKFYKRRSPAGVDYAEATKSIPLPIQLASLSGTSGYLYFLIPQENFECASKNLTVELSTNRHLKLQKTLLLPESLHIGK